MNAKVTRLTTAGFRVAVGGREYIVPYTDYPAFRGATPAQIFNLQADGQGRLRWPDLDVDIEVEALAFPGKYHLPYR